MLCSHLRLGLPRDFFRSSFPLKILHELLITFIRATCLAHAPPPTPMVWQTVQIMKLLIMQFVPNSFHFLLPSVKWFQSLSTARLSKKLTKSYSLHVSTYKVIILPLSLVFLFLGVRWHWVHLVRRPLFSLLYQSRIIDYDERGAISGMRIGRLNRSTGRKPAPVPLCPPQIPHDLIWDRTRAAEVGSQRLTAWTMAQPFSHLDH
jgi:hypothetical protein